MNKKNTSLIALYLPDIRKYCLKLAGSSWDSEDLVQETLTKLYIALDKQPNREINKSYVFRIASNTWVDLCRKNKLQENEFSEDMMVVNQTEDEFEVREAVEWFADYLSVRQMVLILMIDVFQFTSKETAEWIDSTEGAVKEALRRARNRLRLLSSKSDTKRPKPIVSAEQVTKESLETFLDAFRKFDPKGICESYKVLTSQGVSFVKAEKTVEGIYFYLRDPSGHLICISAKK